MSLGIIIKAPEGIVLAAESRVTLTGTNNANGQSFQVNYDNANKLLTFNKPYDRFGVVTYGQASIGFRTAQTFIPEFETFLQNEQGDQDVKDLTVATFAQRLSDFFAQQWALGMPAAYNGQNMVFNVAGFDDNEPYGTVYKFEIPGKPNLAEQNPKINNQFQFGISFGGQTEIVNRLLIGYDPNLFNILMQNGILNQNQITNNILPLLAPLQLQTPIQFMPLQDCVNLALLLIKTTIDTQSLTFGLRGCGGAIDVAIITKNNPLAFIQKKNIIVN